MARIDSKQRKVKSLLQLVPITNQPMVVSTAH
jgi:hypothetical protein